MTDDVIHKKGTIPCRETIWTDKDDGNMKVHFTIDLPEHIKVGDSIDINIPGKHRGQKVEHTRAYILKEGGDLDLYAIETEYQCGDELSIEARKNELIEQAENGETK